MSFFDSRLFFICAVGSFVFFAYISLDRYHDYTIKKMYRGDANLIDSVVNTSAVRQPLKYILQWTRPDTEPFVFMGQERQGFIDRKCEFTNCIITSNRSIFASLSDFDVILFHGPELVYVPILNKDFPKERLPKQKYVFVSKESSHYYPVCSDRLDSFFNWTWTFKLDSTASLGYILIKDSKNVVVGPKTVMHWMKLEDMDPVSEEFKKKLKSKNKTAVWCVSNCKDVSGRMKFAKELKTKLLKLNLDLDIYGKCGSMKCGVDEDCGKLIADNYYFYLAFENSFSEDYVTEKLLLALNNDAIPIVFGGANYTRFLPDGTYLNARELGTELLAKRMKLLIDNPDQYINFFRWKNHYSYHSRDEGPENNDYCQFCAILNDEKIVKQETTIHNFKEWWDKPKRCLR